MKIGRRLSIKLLNVSKFVLQRIDDAPELSVLNITQPLDRDVLSLLGQLIAESTTAFANYDYARALERTETFFWSFCDNYVELVKIRAYGGTDSVATISARATLSTVLSVLPATVRTHPALRRLKRSGVGARRVDSPRPLAERRGTRRSRGAYASPGLLLPERRRGPRGDPSREERGETLPTSPGRASS